MSIVNLNIEEIRFGFVEVDKIFSSGNLLNLASSIGEIIPHPNGEEIYSLSPSLGDKSVKGTFSSRFGLSEFPLHSDTAFWSQPSRYIVLGMFDQSSSDTRIIAWDEIFSFLSPQAKSYAYSASYLIDTIEEKKYASLLFSVNGVRGIRFDPCCMKPVNKAARRFHDEMVSIQQSLKPKTITWTGNKAVVIDNWTCLHGRSAISTNESERKLLRIYIR